MLSDASSTAATWSSVSAFDGRPACPVGTSHSGTTLRLTLSRACAMRTERLRIEYTSRSVRVDSVNDSSARNSSTSSAVSSRSFRAPRLGMMCPSAW